MRLGVGVAVGLWVARYLGPQQFGTLGYGLACVTLLGFLPALGLDAVVKREMLERPASTGELLASTFLLRLGAAAAAYALVVVAVWQRWGLQGEEPRLLAILGLFLFQPALVVPDLWLQAHLRASWSVAAQLSALLVAAALRVALICTGAPLVAFAAVVIVEMMLGAGGLAVVARRLGLAMPLLGARWSVMKELLRESWPLALASFAVLLYMRIDEVMLRHMVGAEAVGIYSAATRLSEIWYFLPVVLGSSVLPGLLRARAQGSAAYAGRLQQYYDVSAAGAYALSIPIAVLAPWIVQLAYGDAYAAAGPVLAVHIWASVFVFLGVARGQWLVNERLPGFYLASTLAGAFANVLLNLLVIPRWGPVGAAWTTLIAQAIASWAASYFHAGVRPTAQMQTRALLIPVLGWRYLKRP